MSLQVTEFLKSLKLKKKKPWLQLFSQSFPHSQCKCIWKILSDSLSLPKIFSFKKLQNYLALPFPCLEEKITSPTRVISNMIHCSSYLKEATHFHVSVQLSAWLHSWECSPIRSLCSWEMPSKLNLLLHFW